MIRALTDERLALAADDPRHGTVNGYGNLKCRCEQCRSAWAAYYREGPGKEAKRRYGVDSGLLKTRYRMAREAGYTAAEAMRRSHWSDPLREATPE